MTPSTTSGDGLISIAVIHTVCMSCDCVIDHVKYNGECWLLIASDLSRQRIGLHYQLYERREQAEEHITHNRVSHVQ